MKKLTSVLTSDMDKCFYTGYRGYDIERHHVFGGANRKRSEEYGYVVPLHPWLHPNGAHADNRKCKQLTNKTLTEIDEDLKKRCQEDFELRHGTRADFINLFGKGYL